MLAKRNFHNLVSVLGLCLVAYFLYHTIEGDRGFVTQERMQTKVDAAQEELTRLQKEHEALDHRVHLMRPESMDPDLLDEESRKTLNYSKPNEIIILSPKDAIKPAAKNE